MSRIIKQQFIMDNQFFNFIKPYLSFIDKGHFFRKPISWLYMILAVLNLILPIYIFYEAATNNIFRAPGEVIFVFILFWLIFALAGWLSFQLWWNRSTKVTETSTIGDDFIATPVFAHFIQTFGEWLGTWIAVVGFSFSLLTTIILGQDGQFLSMQLGLNFLRDGLLYIVLMPVYGFLIVVVSRFLAEQFRALASIANNTRNKDSI